MRHGSHLDPKNRFEAIERELELDQLEAEEAAARSRVHRTVEFIDDESQTIVSENHSPDIPFRYSINPYRGCMHGCSYCYARPGHEFLGMNAGLDFETKIVVKRDAPQLLRAFLAKPRWDAEPITFSGVTDCYQPCERQFQLTRQCLQVMASCGQPTSIVTKNALVVRDLDLLAELARRKLVHVYISITTLDKQLAGAMEPRTSTPQARLRAIERLAEADIPCGVMVAPVIPALNDSEIPGILRAAAAAGAQTAGYVLLRLPLTVEPVFLEWLRRTLPEKAPAVIARIEAARGGKRNDSTFGRRMIGQGILAEQSLNLFRTFRRQLHLDQPLPPHNRDHFRAPSTHGQLRLF